jgi:translocator protein
MDTQPYSQALSLAQQRTHGWQQPSYTGDSRGWQGLVGWFGLTAATAVVGSLASSQADVFYASLDKPGWAPPAWLFGPVWTVLYLLMACAAVMVHRRLSSRPQGLGALRLYALALVPNALWSWTFFQWHLGGVSLAVNVVLWGLLIATVRAFFRVRRASAVLMVPVLLWVSFAIVLNAALLPSNTTLW